MTAGVPPGVLSLVLIVSCRNLRRGEYATPTRSEGVSWATKQRSLAVVCEDRHPLTCVPLITAALLVYETPDCSGKFTVSKTSTKLKTSLGRRKSSGTSKALLTFSSCPSNPSGASDLHHRARLDECLIKFDRIAEAFFRLFHAPMTLA